MSTTTTGRTRRWVVAALVTGTALVAAACVPPPAGGPAPTVPNSVRTVSNAVFEWTVSREADNASLAPGEVNYWSAGQSDSTQATYLPTNGNATVLKKNASGTYVPIGSEPAVSWANRNRDGSGNVVTAFGSVRLGQKVRFTNGTGTVDTATGVTTIQWTGTFTINFYGRFVPFWFTDPKLTVDPSGTGRLTASMGGFASSLDNPEVRTPLSPVAGVEFARIPNVFSGGSVTTGFTRPTAFLGTAITPPPGAGPQVAQTPTNQSFWGAWPQAFVDFQNATGLVSYWYTSGSSIDPKKPQEPVTVSWSLNP